MCGSDGYVVMLDVNIIQIEYVQFQVKGKYGVCLGVGWGGGSKRRDWNEYLEWFVYVYFKIYYVIYVYNVIYICFY